MKISLRTVFWTLVFTLIVLFSGCRENAPAGEGLENAEARHEAEADESITLNPEAIAAAGIRTAPASVKDFRQRISAPGQLELNARRLVHLTARTPGRFERVMAVAGDRVRAGQVLAESYSPDFMSLQAEYLQAAERSRRLADDPSEAATARAILESARERLLLVGATQAELAALTAERVPRPLLPIRAPFAGTVIESGIVTGDHVGIGDSLFRIADLAILWADLRIQEKDLAAVKAGSLVELRTQAYLGEVFLGKLLLVGDIVDEATRTVIARVEVPNPAAKLKAGMYIEAVLMGIGARPALVVPESAVQDDEGRDIVFVESGRGTYRRREVEIGERFPGLTEIRRGLAAGETVVTTGSFLLKSEMNKGSLEEDHGHS